MFLFIDFCACHWIIPWLLPFLLGLLAGWLLWGKYKGMVEELKGEISGLKGKISGLEAELDACRAKRAELDSQLTLMQGQLSEIKASGGASAKGIVGAVPAKKSKAKSKKSSGGGSKNIYSVLTSDNLQVVEGIGPKMDEVLKSQGINSWSELANATPESLRALLDKVNQKRYRIIDPKTWPQQAALANSGDWEGLIALQKQLDTGRTNAGGETDAKVEKLLIKLGALKRWKQNDLKAVEGIGPKIEGLLKADGIDTWRKLANTDVATIQGILDKAGKRYSLADPATWPKQSEMAADGRWDDLDEYQDFLQGGK